MTLARPPANGSGCDDGYRNRCEWVDAGMMPPKRSVCSPNTPTSRTIFCWTRWRSFRLRNYDCRDQTWKKCPFAFTLSILFKLDGSQLFNVKATFCSSSTSSILNNRSQLAAGEKTSWSDRITAR
uniref:(northern house mosquito) hypothetical protein n=1 Tax=Culex pipiens TaxID=7175 RepID=A0A8D8C536_CULPI